MKDVVVLIKHLKLKKRYHLLKVLTHTALHQVYIGRKAPVSAARFLSAPMLSDCAVHIARTVLAVTCLTFRGKNMFVLC